MIKFFLSEIADLFTRQNFERLDRFLQAEPLLRGNFKFFELTFSAAVTNHSVRHGLSFRPLDVIQTYKTDGITVTFIPDSFTESVIKLTTSGACTVRAFIGRYEEG